jgi:hypothetical protein
MKLRISSNRWLWKKTKKATFHGYLRLKQDCRIKGALMHKIGGDGGGSRLCVATKSSRQGRVPLQLKKNKTAALVKYRSRSTEGSCPEPGDQ